MNIDYSDIKQFFEDINEKLNHVSDLVGWLAEDKIKMRDLQKIQDEIGDIIEDAAFFHDKILQSGMESDSIIEEPPLQREAGIYLEGVKIVSPYFEEPIPSPDSLRAIWNDRVPDGSDTPNPTAPTGGAFFSDGDLWTISTHHRIQSPPATPARTDCTEDLLEGATWTVLCGGEPTNMTLDEAMLHQSKGFKCLHCLEKLPTLEDI